MNGLTISWRWLGLRLSISWINKSKPASVLGAGVDVGEGAAVGVGGKGVSVGKTRGLLPLQDAKSTPLMANRLSNNIFGRPPLNIGNRLMIGALVSEEKSYDDIACEFNVVTIGHLIFAMHNL